MKDGKQLISACLVVYNEEKIIRRCLESIKDAVDEIIVVHDGGCIDNTLDICREYTSNIFVRKHVGVCEAHRVFAFKKAKGDWILQIDADEFLSRELKENIRVLVNQERVDGYSFLWPYTNGRKYITRRINYPHKTCLMRKNKMYFIGIPHQALKTYGKLQVSDLLLEHKPNYNNFTWKSFKIKWLKWGKIHARYLCKDFDVIPKFNVKEKSWDKKFISRRNHPIVYIPFIFFRGFLGSVKAGMWKVGIIGIKIAILHSLYYACVYYYVYKFRKESIN